MKRVESICVYNVLQLLFVSCHGAPAVRDTCNLVAPEKHTRRQKKVPQTGLRLAANKKKNSSHDTTCVDLCSLFSVGKNRQSH